MNTITSGAMVSPCRQAYCPHVLKKLSRVLDPIRDHWKGAQAHRDYPVPIWLACVLVGTHVFRA